MILCNDCGERNEDQAAWCTRCGVRSPLPAPGRKPAQRSKSPVIVAIGSRICRACGTPSAGTTRFCVHCGFTLVDAKAIGKRAWWRRLLRRDRISVTGILS